ncbi:MAG: WbuC family cupin fold metalloprotein [Cyanobacteria bacterium P01_A01_bin.3]
MSPTPQTHTLLTQALLDSVAAEASDSTRLRKNYNFHQLNETVQRMLNVLQPGTYVRPHRHMRPEGANGFEFFLVLQGKLGMLTFDRQGEICDRVILSADGPAYGIELEEGVYHSLLSLAPDTVIFELKEGPYNAATDKEFLPMFPDEGTQKALALANTIWPREFPSA